MARYDIEAAQKAGVPEAEIVEQIVKREPLYKIGTAEEGELPRGAETRIGKTKVYDVKAAQEAGVPDSEIVRILKTGRGFDRSGDPVKAFERGAVTGTAQILGAPVDLGVDVLNQMRRAPPATSPFSGAEEAPIIGPVFGGSSSIKRGFRGLGLNPYERLEDLPPEERPLAAAGEVFGGGLPIAGAPIGLAKAGVKGKGIFAPILTMARESPARFAAVEATSLAGSAQGAAISELYFPGDQGVRLGAEVVGGFLNPVGVVLKAVSGTTQAIKDMVKGFTKVGREAKVSKLLQDAIRGAGEDPVEIARRLRETELPGVKLTSGQKTGSPTLLAVERRLAKENENFAGDANKLVKDSFEALRTITDKLTAEGSPAALATAARVREQYFSGIVSARLNLARTNAAKAWANVGKADAQLASKRAHAVLDETLHEVRKIEGELWEAIDKKTPMRPEGTVRAYDDLRETMLKSESVDPIVEAEVARMRGEGEPAASAGDLLRLRSRMLRLARDARATPGGSDKARQYTAIAEGALEDLSQLPGTAAEIARTFSRELHDSFTRTFAGDALGSERSGALKIDPELMLERAFGRGGTSGDINFRELAEAAGFSGGQAELEFAASIRGQTMLSEQENFLRVAADATTETGGRVNPKRLQDFVEKNEAIMVRFPELRRHLMDSVTAEQTFRDMEGMATVAREAIQKRAAFAQLVGIENVPEAIGKIITSKSPERNYSQLVRMAKKGDAVEGLKAATLEYAARQATNADGNFSFAKYNEIMTKPVAGGKSPGVLDMMERQGVLNRRDNLLLRKVLTRAQEIEAAMSNTTRMNEVLQDQDALVDLVIRIAGSRVGAAGAMGAASGSSLVAAGAGVRFMRNILNRVPNVR
ncbi:MAG: hypothetical protein NUV75_11740, partial [Gallionella sp.]|nr:hypothetical protein [Gallionella sp.]